MLQSHNLIYLCIYLIVSRFIREKHANFKASRNTILHSYSDWSLMNLKISPNAMTCPMSVVKTMIEKKLSCCQVHWRVLHRKSFRHCGNLVISSFYPSCQYLSFVWQYKPCKFNRPLKHLSVSLYHVICGVAIMKCPGHTVKKSLTISENQKSALMKLTNHSDLWLPGDISGSTQVLTSTVHHIEAVIWNPGNHG